VPPETLTVACNVTFSVGPAALSKVPNDEDWIAVAGIKVNPTIEKLGAPLTAGVTTAAVLGVTSNVATTLPVESRNVMFTSPTVNSFGSGPRDVELARGGRRLPTRSEAA
jgi:hypothetical protein